MNNKLSFIAVLFSTILLQACIPAVLVTGAAATGLVLNDNRSIQTMSDDRKITFDAQRKIALNPDLNTKAHISVISYNHLVILVGQAPTPEQRELAASIVNEVPKIKHIYNEITIEEPSTSTTRSNDTWITTKVKADLLGTKGVQSTQITIITEKGTVYLLGMVVPEQGDLAAKVASKVPGVKKVVKAFEYIKE